MISTKNRKTQCKETEQLYEQLKNNLSDNVAAFSEKYSKFAVKRLLLYHFEKSFTHPVELNILTGPQSVQLFLQKSKLDGLTDEFAPEILKLFVNCVQWNLDELSELIRTGAIVPSFPEAFHEPVKEAATSALSLTCRNLLEQNPTFWNEFSAELLSSHFAEYLSAEEILECCKANFLEFYCQRIGDCSTSIVGEVVQLMNRTHLERLHELIVSKICSNLLNVGHETEKIVQKLVETIATLRRLDKSGFLSGQVLNRVRLYLKHRKDLNRSLLNFLLTTNESFSFNDAVTSNPHALHFEELQAEENWQPEPSFVTEPFSKVAKTAHPIVLILLSLSSMEALQEEFQNFLSEHLLKCPTEDSIRELAAKISGLKKRCGFELSVAAEVMFRDVFENRLLSPDLSVTIISNRYWPERSKNSLSHPETILEKLEVFATSFNHKNSTKNVTWRPHLDEVDLELTFTNGTFPFRAPPEAATLLTSFDFPADAQESFDFKLLSMTSGITDKSLLKSALLFWLKKRVIVSCQEEAFHFRFATSYDDSCGDCVDAHLTLFETNEEFADEEQSIDADVLALQSFWPIIGNMFKTFGQLSLERIHSTLSMFSKEYKGPVTLLSRYLQQKVKEGVLNVSGNKIIVYSTVNK